MQLEFLIHELTTGYKSVFQKLQTATSVSEAAIAVLTGFEKPADQGVAVQKRRTEYGQTFYDMFAKGTAVASSSFKVRITITDLNIRTGAGTNYPRTGKCTGIGVFTIVETKPGEGSKAGWGKLKSGQGWVSLDYCTRI